MPDLTRIPSPVKGASWFQFRHGGRTGIVAGRGRYWKAAWVTPRRRQPFGDEVSGAATASSRLRLVEGVA